MIHQVTCYLKKGSMQNCCSTNWKEWTFASPSGKSSLFSNSSTWDLQRWHMSLRDITTWCLSICIERWLRRITSRTCSRLRFRNCLERKGRKIKRRRRRMMKLCQSQRILMFQRQVRRVKIRRSLSNPRRVVERAVPHHLRTKAHLTTTAICAHRRESTEDWRNATPNLPNWPTTKSSTSSQSM